MKLCKPCDTKLFNGADSCGICGNKDLILLSSPKSTSQEPQRPHQFYDEMEKLVGQDDTHTRNRKILEQQHRHRQIMARHRGKDMMKGNG